MSDYPPTPSYGANSWSREQPNPPHLPPYPPPFPNQYLQPNDGRTGRAPMASNYDTSMSAYGYNGAIPGFSAAAVASGVPPLPIFQGWNQDSIPLPPYTSPQNAPQYAEYSDGSHHNAQYFPPVEPQHYQHSTQAAKPFDNGELSEGEFEDNSFPGNTAPVSYGINQYQGNGGYVDTAHRAVYSRSQDFSPAQGPHPGNDYNYTRESPNVRRQQSDSYSPHTPTPERTNGTPQNHHGWMQNGTDSSRSVSLANGQPAPKTMDAPRTIAPLVQPPLGQVNSAMANRLVESRKKAQGAVLNLWPLEVRFQNYIDEGFDERLVGRLFDDLGIPRVPSKSINGTQGLAEAEKYPATLPQAPNQEENLAPRPSNSTATVGAQSLKLSSGYQHDKVLPERKAKQLPTVSSANISTSPSTKAATVTTPAKSTGATEKERTLQMKMEALRKSREERAQKAAAKNQANSAVAPVPATVSQQELPKPASVAKISSSPSTSPLPMTQHQSPSHQVLSNPSPQTSGPLQQAPLIPGLFLTSTAASPAPSITYNATQVNQRKRPVAADFDTPTMVANPFKRPFGQSRHEQPLVIDVSDEELDSGDEDVAMDIESQADQESPVQETRIGSDHRNVAIQNLPPLSNFPAQTPFTPPNGSTTNTPPISQVPANGSLGRPDVLLAKETEIEKLKKKIAEAEARKKAKRTPSGIRTPRIVDTNSTDSKSNDTEDIASKIAASIEMQNLIGIVENEVISDQQRFADAQAAEQEKAAELKRNEAERKRLRREKIATDLPRVDAEVQENQTKLEQLRAEMAKIEAAVQKNLEDKRKMAEEMERLGQETEDQLQAQKDKLEDLTSEETRIHNDSSRSPLPAVEEAAEVTKPPSFTNGQAQRPLSIPLQGNTWTESSVSDLGHESQQASVASVSLNSDAGRVEELPHPITEPVMDGPKDGIVVDHVLEAALQEAVRAEVDSHAQGERDMDIEDFYASEPNQLAPGPSLIPPADEKRSPVYSPVFERSDVADGESDNYEPPEAPLEVEKPSIDSPPFSPAPPETISEFKPDATPVDDALQIIDHNGRGSTGGLLLQQNGSIPLLFEHGNQEKSNQTQFFTPYESPLKLFRAYRFHPEFQQTVPGGLRSVTYSHKIDPDAELCRYELAGGVCNDPTCEFQHFREIGLPDDAVLTALGSPDEFTGPQREKFCEGLKEVLTNLRVRKIRDFDIIAAEIVAHRSKFLGDNSKVLMLEGTSI